MILKIDDVIAPQEYEWVTWRLKEVCN
jgi:hypothetical protein